MGRVGVLVGTVGNEAPPPAVVRGIEAVLLIETIRHATGRGSILVIVDLNGLDVAFVHEVHLQPFRAIALGHPRCARLLVHSICGWLVFQGGRSLHGPVARQQHPHGTAVLGGVFRAGQEMGIVA